jgi:hypothetical protein
MDGSLAGTDSWFHDSQAQASSDYGVGKDGTIYQWVDWTQNQKAWAEVAGNPNWVSIENEGHSGDLLTGPQLESVSQIVAHVFSLDNVPFVATNDPNGRGLGYHAMGGDAWGGHYDCPGDPIIAQRQAILTRAQELVNGGFLMALSDTEQAELLGKVRDVWNVLGPMRAELDAAKAELDQVKAEVDAIKAKDGA